ncbi:ATP-binding cassette domain-containing protein [Bacillus sp. UNCCL81]|uniref:ATP-binding cassette domain-containing protein n=1 Tax=Bacillus sp. UNCCL81 TaxID=1502755 RepID=UPI0008EA56DF|nr:ATP-binding cassette domain-containing protein [Bacillus sp. UNCCL81]SFC42542.1 ABC-2 type transport system ATP-binding protein [Bacillus sp. UNCCL81]
MNYIEVNELSKKIKNKVILDNISLQLKKGEIYGFYGRNGSGKTMFFRTICGLIKPTSGSITVDGKTLHIDVSFPSNLGVIIETPGFWPFYSAYENLLILSKIKKLITPEEVKDSIERVGLDPNDPSPVKNYSLGMKQRLGIAQAIMEKPDLIILDEPTNALDEDGVELTRQILLSEKERGATILLASHNKEDLNILADKKYKMVNGKLYNDSSEAG